MTAVAEADIDHSIKRKRLRVSLNNNNSGDNGQDVYARLHSKHCIINTRSCHKFYLLTGKLVVFWGFINLRTQYVSLWDLIDKLKIKETMTKGNSATRNELPSRFTRILEFPSVFVYLIIEYFILLITMNYSVPIRIHTE